MQRNVAARVAELLPDARIIDRIEKPSHGYRSLHVVVRQSGKLVEVQVRTHLQHSWALLCERVASELGKGIKYGEDVDEAGWPDRLEKLSRTLADVEEEVDRSQGVSKVWEAFRVYAAEYKNVWDTFHDEVKRRQPGGNR